MLVVHIFTLLLPPFASKLVNFFSTYVCYGRFILVQSLAHCTSRINNLIPDTSNIRCILSFSDSAQLVKIWLRGKICPAIGANLDNYFYTHQSYVHPDIVLNKTNISLHSVDESKIIFIMTKHSVDVQNFPR